MPCLNFCFPPRAFACRPGAWNRMTGLTARPLSFSRRRAELSGRDTSFLVPASCQLDVLPPVVSDRRGFLSSAGEGCPQEVWSVQWLARLPSGISESKRKAELQRPFFHSSSTTVAIATEGCCADWHPEKHHSLKLLCGAPVASQ